MKIHARRTRLVALALSAAVWLASTGAWAQPNQPEIREPDSATIIGGFLSSVGTALLIAGAAVHATSAPDLEERFGSEVVVTASGSRGVGAALLGAGGGLVLAGIPAILFGLYGPREHMSEKRMGVGMVLTMMAAATAGMGAAVWAAPHVRADKVSVGGLGSAAGLVSIGLPLLVSGAPPPPREPSLRSPAMAYAGYALFGLTLLGVSAGVAGILAYQSEGGLGGLDAGVRGMTAVGFAGSLTLTGIPLVAAGSQPARTALSSSSFGIAF